MNQNNTAKIKLEHVFKSFNIGCQRSEGALAKALSFISGRGSKRAIKVLDDISLQVFSGENVGLIGGNGSGKSTLLRIIADIYRADSGIIKAEGSVLYINGFNFGLKPRLSMRDNIFLIGSIMGLNSRQVKHRLGDIVSFAGLEEFLDTKIFQFSSGMANRLCFSAVIHCLQQKVPNVILLDEVFSAGGDADFQKKAIEKMEEFLRGGSAVILVSHQMEIISKYCHRVILLEKGAIKEMGSVDKVINSYLKL